ncbi:UNVERIFIED_CONTAM: hypothetical protein RMT77_010042 [Armadillidium vulgare]
MGKKSKLGKNRKDVFYHRAKESGYRARASFKLIQLNKKYNFLQSSRVCIDLCAAPGSWMQVASKFMPVSSVIIGVDRYAIAPIPNTISIQGDITTEKVRQDLRSNLKTWKADLVLHDGAPNVGQNWLHDSYQQNLLVLHAFKLACEFLQKGGTFVSKVFRSKDHLSLQYVFRKLFKKVEATKPIASRFESAEIFIVCQGFLAPDKVDPQFFDPKYVFQSLESEPKNTINVLKPEKTKKKAVGYEEGATILFKKKLISEFIHSSKYIEILEEANEFEWDLPAARESVHTNSEIIEFCKDIKVLNRKDLRILINWRKAVKADIEEEQKQKKKEEKPAVVEENDEKDEVDEELEELQKIQEEVVKLKEEQKKEEKRHIKKVEKKRKRQEEKMKLLLSVPGDPGPQETSANGLFSLESINKVDALDNIIDQGTDIMIDQNSDEEEIETQPKRKKLEYYSKESANLQRAEHFGGKTVMDSEDEEESSSEDEGLNIEEEKTTKKKVRFADSVSYNEDDDDSEPDDDTNKTNPLLTDLVGDNESDRRERKAEKWFSKMGFEDIEDDDIEDYEIETAVQKHEEAGGIILKKNTEESVPEINNEEEKSVPKKEKIEPEFKVKDGPDSDSDLETDDDDASDSGVDSEDEKEMAKEAPKKKKTKGPVLSNLGLALATKMIHSKKTERDMYDEGWNRYMWGDENLPDWFVEDERKNNAPAIKVENEDLKMYENNNKAVDARTIKKVVEAKARKQRRMRKRMNRARKKAENIAEDPDMTAREKAVEMNKVYKKASSFSRPKEKKYVVMRKCFGGVKPKAGQKGPSKMVDRRLKKDKRALEKLRRKRGKKIKL